MATPYPRYGVDARKDMGNEYPICALRPVLSLKIFRGFLSVYLGWAGALRLRFPVARILRLVF